MSILLRPLSYLCAIVCILIGALVIIGWHAHWTVLIQIMPDNMPMHYNSALCFILSGLALAAINKESFSLSRVFTSLILVISSLTLIEYLFSMSLGIDELFVQSYITTVQSYPGRMGINTAFCWLIASIVLWMLMPPYSKKSNLIGIFGIIFIFCSGMLLMINHLANLTTYFAHYYGIVQWAAMSFHAAFGLVILSIGLLASMYHPNEKKRAVSLLPFFIGTSIFMITILSWESLKKDQDIRLRQLMQIKVEEISNALTTQLIEQANAFSHLTYRWSNHPHTSQTEWQTELLHYVNDQPGYEAIEWVTNDYQTSWIIPPLPSLKKLSAFQKKYLSETTDSIFITPQLSAPFELGDNTTALLLIRTQIKNDGYMIGILNVQSLLNYILHNDTLKYSSVALYDNDKLFYSSQNPAKNTYDEWSTHTNLSVLGRNWHLLVWPRTALFKEVNASWMPFLLVIAGTFIALLSGFLVRMLQLLKRGVEKRNAIQAEWSNTNSQLHGIIEGSSDLIAALDLDFNFLAFNSMYQKEIFRLFHIDLKRGMNFSTLLNRMSAVNREKAIQLWTKAFEGNSFTVVENFEDARFSDLIFEIHYNPIRNEKNKLIGASHIATNVYERIQNELKIITAKKRLEILVMSLENQNKELTFLKEMINILQGSLSLKDTIQPLKTYIKKILVNSSGAIYLTAKDDEEMCNELLSWGTAKAHVKTVHKNDCWALMRNQVHSCLQPDEELVCQHVSSLQKNKPAYLCLPMQAQSETLGLFYLEIIHKDQLDTKRVINLSQIMAEQIALSFFNIQLQEELKNQSAHDSLTGLYNRRFFEEYIKKEFYQSEREPRTFALLLIDIDFFKKINDSHGHLIGDYVLKTIAGELLKNCRKSDLVCRWGGEEFLLFLRESNLMNIKTRAETLRESIQQLIIDFNSIQLPPITISIGVAFYPFDGTDLDSLIAKADEALYEAKRNGRNKVIISPNNIQQMN